jgi:hypothetical protein
MQQAWEEKRNAYIIFDGKTRRKETTWKIYRCRWEDNMKMDLREIGWGGRDWNEWLRIGTSGGLF